MEEEIEENFTRVTEVLNIYSGLSRVPQSILDKACERGTKVHHIIDGIVSGLGHPEIPDELSGYIQSFLKWNSQYPESHFIFPERFYDKELRLTGKCDVILRVKNKYILIDFKTSSKESKSWALQGSAYAFLARCAGWHIDEIQFIKLSKIGEDAEIFTYDNQWPIFLKCLEIYRYFK